MSFDSKDSKDIYDYWLIVCKQEGYTLNWETVRKILIAVREHFKRKGNLGIAKYIDETILKECEIEAGDWDNIRFLLHREIDETQPEPYEFLEMIKKKYGSL